MLGQAKFLAAGLSTTAWKEFDKACQNWIPLGPCFCGQTLKHGCRRQTKFRVVIQPNLPSAPLNSSRACFFDPRYVRGCCGPAARDPRASPGRGQLQRLRETGHFPGDLCYCWEPITLHAVMLGYPLLRQTSGKLLKTSICLGYSL